MDTVRPCRLGFTLIELLVVVAIIVVLLSILMPSLNKAREEARKVKCASNGRQIGLGLLMYSAENADVLPKGNNNMPVLADRWTTLLVKKYGVPGSVFICPTRVNLSAYLGGSMDVWKTADTQSANLDFWQLPSYGFNYNHLNYIKTVSLQQPARLVLLAESNWLNDENTPSMMVSSSANGYWVQPTHNDMYTTNIVWADVHVESLRALAQGNAGRGSFYQPALLGTRYTKNNCWTIDHLASP